jgi:hypothetical protein
MRGKMTPAVLADMAVPGQDVAAVEVELLLGQPVKMEQPDHAGNLDLEIDRPNPIFLGLFEFSAQLAHFPPQIEGIGEVLSLFKMDDFRQFAAKEAEGAADIDDMDRHIQTVEHQDAARERCTGWGMRWGVCDNGPPSRAFRPWNLRVGRLNRLHVQTPVLRQSLDSSKLDRWCLRRFHDFFIVTNFFLPCQRHFVANLKEIFQGWLVRHGALALGWITSFVEALFRRSGVHRFPRGAGK